MTNRMLGVRQTHLFAVDPREIDADAVLTATVRRGDEGRFQPVRGGDDDGVVRKGEQGGSTHASASGELLPVPRMDADRSGRIFPDDFVRCFRDRNGVFFFL